MTKKFTPKQKFSEIQKVLKFYKGESKEMKIGGSMQERSKAEAYDEIVSEIEEILEKE